VTAELHRAARAQQHELRLGGAVEQAERVVEATFLEGGDRVEAAIGLRRARRLGQPRGCAQGHRKAHMGEARWHGLLRLSMLRPPMLHKWSLAVVSILASAFAFSGGCAPKLGDGCKSGQDCSVNGDRTCDVAQPGGYCTIVDCSPGGCGDEGYCVRFRPDEPRLSRNYCMAQCGDTGDCNRDAYVCRGAAQLNDRNGDGMVDDEEEADRLAEIIDSKKKNKKFCVVKQDPAIDAGVTEEPEMASEDAGG
jgi:hypothetical protein